MTQDDSTPRGLLPPRPNLGPEPWYEARPIPSVLYVSLLIPGALLLCWFFWSLLRRGRVLHGRVAPAPEDHRPDATPRDRLVALSNSIREALTVRYGTTWRSKTTEELSADTQLVGTIGHEAFAELIRFLDQVDRIKFAPERSNQHHQSLQRDLEIWEPRVADFKAKIRAKPGGRRGRQTIEPGSRLRSSRPMLGTDRL